MPMLGFLLIYFMIYKRPRNLEDREWMADYEDFHNHNCMRWLRSELTVSAYAEYIAHDLELCGQHDHALLTYLVPFIYRECPRISKDCPMIFRAIIAYLDASEIMSLVCAISQKKMVMLSDKGCTDVISTALNACCFIIYSPFLSRGKSEMGNDRAELFLETGDGARAKNR